MAVNPAQGAVSKPVARRITLRVAASAALERLRCARAYRAKCGAGAGAGGHLAGLAGNDLASLRRVVMLEAHARVVQWGTWKLGRLEPGGEGDVSVKEMCRWVRRSILVTY